MNQADKDKIRAALSRAAGHDVGQVYPDGFQSASAGNIIAAAVQHSGAPYLKTAMVSKHMTAATEARNLWFFGLN